VAERSLDDIVARWEKEFPGVDASVVEPWSRLRLASKLIERFQREALEPFDLQVSDYQVLAALVTAPDGTGMLPRALCAALYQTPAGMTKTLDRLEGRAFVQRNPDSADRRAIRVTLTRKGRTLARKVCLAEIGWQEEIFAPLGESERKRFSRLLERLIRSLSDRIEERG